jgi:hypothetical protein
VCPPTTVTGSITAGDAQQNLRIFRDGAASTCAAPKAVCPGTTGAGTRSFDQYSFVNTDSVTRCITAMLTGTTCSGLNVFGTTYLGSFNPTNICQNYLADPGVSSNPTASWSFNVPAGATFVIVVAEVNQGQGCTGYSVTVSGLPCLTDGGGQCVPCSIICPNNITQPNDPNQCGAIVTFAPTSNGTCGVVVCSPASGSFFPVGTTTVTCNTTQGSSCSFTVKVNDTQPPTISCPSNITVNNDPGQCGAVVTFAPTASDNCPGVTSSCTPASGSVFPIGTTTVTCKATDASGNMSANCTFTVTVNSLLAALGQAKVWIGLKNSDDVGTNFDLLAEVLKNGTTVGTGQISNIAGGSSGFNNAVLRSIGLALSSGPVSFAAGDTLGFRLSVRITAVGGHRSGTARLWYNGAAIDAGATRDAGSRFGDIIACFTGDHFLRTGFLLNASAGASKQTIDVFVDRAVGGNPFKPFGTWTKTF